MKPNILLVDDEEISNFLARRLFELAGTAERVDTVTNGMQALEIIHEYHTSNRPQPDIIFLDINMPVLDGFEFMNEFNQLTIPQKEKIQIIVTSSSMDSKDALKAKQLGAREFVSKPLTLEFIRSVANG